MKIQQRTRIVNNNSEELFPCSATPPPLTQRLGLGTVTQSRGHAGNNLVNRDAIATVAIGVGADGRVGLFERDVDCHDEFIDRHDAIIVAVDRARRLNERHNDRPVGTGNTGLLTAISRKRLHRGICERVAIRERARLDEDTRRAVRPGWDCCCQGTVRTRATFRGRRRPSCGSPPTSSRKQG